MEDNQVAKPYANGGEMWHDYAASYGIITARVICRQLREEISFAPNMKNAEVYMYSDRLAEFNGEIELFNESDRINRLCGADIDEAIFACEYGDGSHDFKTALDALSDHYGLERVRVVLAAEANWHGFMGQMSGEEYQWAQSLKLDEQFYGGFHLRTRPDVLKGLIAEIQGREAMHNKKELTREEMITAIMADILKHDPEHPVRSLKYIEGNMRKKDISDLRDDYLFYFPNEKVNVLNNEVEGGLPDILYKRHANPGRTAVHEGFVQRYERTGTSEIKPGEIVFLGTMADCNTVTNKLNDSVISERLVSVLRDIGDYVAYQGAVMAAGESYPKSDMMLRFSNEAVIKLCYEIGINAVPYTQHNVQKWHEGFNHPQPKALIANTDLEKMARIKEVVEGMDYNSPNPRQEYSKEEIKQAENVDIKGFLTASYPDKVALKGNQLLFKNAKDETVSVNVSDSDKNGLFFNTVTQGSGKGIINFLRQETGASFKNAVGALLTYSQASVPEQSEEEKAAFALHQERKLNVECGKAIDQALADTYTPGEMAGTGYYDCKAAVKSVIEKYGVDRAALVLAANINAADHDGRINAQNKAWAKNITASDKPDTYLNAHKTVIDMFANRFREATPPGYEQEAQTERSNFAPPDYAETTNNVYNYLTGKLSFDKGIIKSCIENGNIYQTDVYSEKLDKNVPCAVFAGFDDKGEMQSAVIKGFGSYENVEKGSHLKIPFVLPARETNNKQATAVSVFNDPLETLAGATLAKMKDKSNYANIHRLSVVKTWLISTHAKALREFLESHPQVRTVNLCLQNTDDGRKIAESIKNMLRDYSETRGEPIKVNDLIPKETKDFQEQLQNKIGEMKEKRKANENRE